MKIAFLGLGRMGAGMAARLADGHDLTVWNRSPDKARPLAALGAKIADTAEAAVADADLVVTSLPDDASVEALLGAGAPGLAAMRANPIHLCVTTISMACADRLETSHATSGRRYVSGPVVGRPDTAARGGLLQFLAGDASATAEILPVIKAFAARTIPLPGKAGVANGQKLCVNFVAASLLETMGEAFTLADALGVSRPALAAFLDACFASPEIKAYVARLDARESSASNGFAMTAGLKDIKLMREAAASVHCRLDIADTIADKMEQAIALGMGGLDWSAVQEISRVRSGLDTRTY